MNNDRSPWSPVETWMTDYQFPIFQLPGPRFKNRTEGGNPGYYKEGFLTLQDGVSRVLIEMLSGKSTNDIDIEMRRFPYPIYADDKFLVALQGWLPLIIMLSFIYPALNIVKSIVHEKERRLKVRLLRYQNTRSHYEFITIMTWFTGIHENDGPSQLAALDSLVRKIAGLHPDYYHFNYRIAKGKNPFVILHN